MDIPLPGNLGGIFGVVAVLAIAFSALQFGTVKNLRETNNDLRDRITDFLAAGKESERKITELEQRVTVCESEASVLREVNSQQAKWEAVVDLLQDAARSQREHHAAAERHWKREEAQWNSPA